MMNSEHIEITLEANGRCLYSVIVADIGQDITIGRAADCTWRLPETDRMASSHHAVIKKTAGGIKLLDTGSKNGIFCDGKRVSEIALSVGKHVSIADAELIVSKSTVTQDVSERGEHTLEYVGGKHKGEVFPINKKIFLIGAAADNDLVIDENLISQHHIELRTDEAGACWIMDMNSTNGTRINHSTLPGGKERMLKDGDIISLAFVDLRFLDKNVKHTRSFLGLKILAAVITVALLVSGYFAYLAASPSAYDQIQKARKLAYEAKFDRAKEILESVSSARDIDKFQDERDILLGQIATWELTLQEWHNIGRCMKDKRWVDAIRSLSAIHADRMESWNWNEDEGAAYKALAIRIKNNIDLYLQAQGDMENPDRSIAELKQLEQKLRELLEAEKKLKPEPMLAGLTEDIGLLHKKLTENLKNHERLQNVLARLSVRVPNFKEIVDELEKIENSSQGIVKHLAAEYAKPIRKLQVSQDRLLTNAAALTCLEFDKIDSNLNLPAIDECAVNPYINTQRNTIIRINNNFIQAHKQVLYMHKQLQQWKITPPERHALLVAFTDRERLETILACDSLGMKLPVRNRRAPQGMYDRMLGIEYFYEFLRTLPGKYDGAVLDRMHFTPECVSLKKLCEHYSNFVNFAELPENRWMLRGKLKGLHDYCAEELKARDSLIAMLRADPAAPLSRRAIICRGMIIYFTPADTLDKKYLEDFVRDFKKYREPIAVMNNEYDNAPPEKAIELRDKILRTGLPGDPIVRRMWATIQ